MPANRQCAPRSSTSSPARKARWAYSSAPSAWPEREPRSASPTSSTTCSEWLGWLPRPHQPDPKDPLPSRPRAPHHRPNPPTTAQPNAQLSFRLDRPVIGGLQLIHDTLGSNAYAFSVDDAVGLALLDGDGLIITVGGPANLPCPHPLTGSPQEPTCP